MSELISSRENQAGSLDQTINVALDGLTAYINAGGRGTRLNTLFTPDARLGVSKALIEIGIPPITMIEHHINKLQDAGISNIVVGVGDHDNVARFVQETHPGQDSIHTVYTSEQLGTGGDLVRAIRAHDDIFDDQILITNVDTLVDLDEAAIVEFHRSKQSDLTIGLTLNKGVPNEHAYFVGHSDEVVYSNELSGNIRSKEEALTITKYRGSSTGMLVAQKAAIREIGWQPSDGPLSLYKDVAAFVLTQGMMYAYNNDQRLFSDIGTVDTWNDFQHHTSAWQRYIHYKKQ